MSSTCKHCQKSLADCQEADKQLIIPFNPLVVDLSYTPVHVTSPSTRSLRAFCYKLGCYDPKTNMIYAIKSSIPLRVINDIDLSLPLCVWSPGGSAKHMLMAKRNNVIRENVFELPLEKDYITILYILLWVT